MAHHHLVAAALLLCLAITAAPAAAVAGAGASSVLRQGGGAAPPPPPFCHNLDCPRYSVEEATDDWELRAYEAGTWVSTDVEAYAYALASSTGFKVRVCVGCPDGWASRRPRGDGEQGGTRL